MSSDNESGSPSPDDVAADELELNGEGTPNGDVADEEVEDEDDLFGDGEDGDDTAEKRSSRRLDDADLDSGDDEGRNDRMPEGDEEDEEELATADIAYTDATLTRHAIPEPTDGELYALKIPRFMGIEPSEFDHKSFQPPATDHHNRGPPTATFSPYNTALSTIRWRQSPSDPSEYQSNARILRWSDGSLTLQLASDPTTQYEMNGNPLAPPQRNPVKPTPTSIIDRKGRAPHSASYNSAQDSFTYLGAPNRFSSMVRISNKITTGLAVVPPSDKADDAIERLQNAVATARQGHAGFGTVDDGAIEIVKITEDPELAKRKAEATERERVKAQRRLEAQTNRERDRTTRVMGRSGMRGTGLTAAGLEDEDGGKRRGAGARRPTRPFTRRDEYSDDDEYYGRRRTREDEYEEDDFVAGSEEEEALDVEEDDEEDIDAKIERQEKERARVGPGPEGAGGRESTPKRSVDDVDDEEERPASAHKVKKRRVVVDEDEDEE